ncbi:MAG: glycosyltransferase family 4 protein [Pirellulales bacterium]|nr:glycosyltransferase family 4 protein [Pirellulales bacterium]
MHIWMINHYAVPLGGKSGSRHAALAKYLRQAGHDITLFAASIAHGSNETLNSTEFRGKAAYVEEQRDGVRWRFIRSKAHCNNFERFLLMRKFGADVLKSLQGLSKPDVVIGSCVHPYAVEAARRIARDLGIPFIYEIRDIWPESLVDVSGLSRWHPVYALFRRMEIKAFRDADGVIALLPGVRDYAARHGIDPSRTCYLPNGIDPAGYPELPAPQERSLFRFSYFGAHGPANGLENVLLAAEILQKSCQEPIEIQFVGDGSEKKSLMAKADALGLENVCFKEPLAKSALRVEAEKSDGFLFNLKKLPIIEKYGLSANKLFEYLIHGRPIVFSCSSYNNPVAEADAGVSVPPQSPQALAEAMLALARTDSKAREQMGRRGREYALAHHDLSKLACKLADFLEQQVNGSLSPKTKRAA